MHFNDIVPALRRCASRGAIGRASMDTAVPLQKACSPQAVIRRWRQAADCRRRADLDTAVSRCHCQMGNSRGRCCTQPVAASTQLQ
eukprot:6185337-Pleurochrysis_carterae.AAC.1